MYGDFSRVLDGLSGQYSAVLAQQGRLLLDAELNEQTAILLEYMRRVVTDLIGPFAGPIHHAGFEVEPVVEDEKCRAVRLSRGHYYVYGVRCESPAPNRSADEELPIGEHEAPFVVYLTVWEQAVSAIQAPDLADPALGNGVPDTTRRSQVRWRPVGARHLPGSEDDLVEMGPESIVRAFHEYNADPRHRPTLGARAHLSGGSDAGPSMAPTAGGYRGIENQLYRVEVHRSGDEESATFKWSRDNGSVEFGLDGLSDIDGEGNRTATLDRAWYDARQGLEVGDWVEFVDDHWAPLGTPPPLMRVQTISLAARQLTLEDSDPDRRFDVALHPLIRRWDQKPDSQAPNHGIALEQAAGGWFELEDGIQVQFEAREAQYERGDFWLIPARTATGSVLWPQSQGAEPGPLALAPHGPARHLAPLALVKELEGEPIDLRVRFGRRTDEHEAWRGEDDLTLERKVPADAEPAVIRAPTVNYRVRSISTLESGSVFPVHNGTTVGRAADAGIRFDHPDISRHHAVFEINGDVLTITDLGSTNGTSVNDQPRLTAREPAQLAPGDTIEIGSSEAQLQVEEA